MRLSNLAIMAIKGGGRETKVRIAKALKVRVQRVYEMVKVNHDNLTKAAALEVIREITGLEDDQILDREEEDSQESEEAELVTAA